MFTINVKTYCDKLRKDLLRSYERWELLAVVPVAGFTYRQLPLPDGTIIVARYWRGGDPDYFLCAAGGKPEKLTTYQAVEYLKHNIFTEVEIDVKSRQIQDPYRAYLERCNKVFEERGFPPDYADIKQYRKFGSKSNDPNT